MSDPRPASPCVGICRLNGAGTHCLGCGRTLDEIAVWSSLDTSARAAVMEHLPARLAALGIKPIVD